VAVGAAIAVEHAPAWLVLGHYALAALLGLCLTAAAVLLWFPPAGRRWSAAGSRLPDALTIVSLILLELGAAAALEGDGGALGLAHRIAAGAGLALAIAVWLQAVRSRPRNHPAALTAEAVAALFLAQAAIGIWVLAHGDAAAADVLHAATTSLAWLGVCTLSAMSRILPAPDPAPAASDRPAAAREIVADYVTLVKPGIMLLILVTAAGAMAFAADGLPSVRLTLATLLGLALSSGGASAINHYADRDIDQRMTRTAVRPVASGRVAPEAALGFGIGLMVASFAVLAVNVNVLTAVLALSGGLTYVLLYTYWLKRRTPQNIVWGGAAGAIPPLVGWAAVTGHVGLPAVFMFLIIFLWTPPHFWALAILAKREYAKAGVPMLPVVRGDRETARQILIYTLLLVGISLLPFASHTFGWIYLCAALVLGGRFVQLALRLVRDTAPPQARRLFLYSLAYLALLFVAIGVDRIRIGG
jgi:protoheme IX farnesyltransferase